MAQNIDYAQALADIKQGFQNVLPRVQVSGNKVTLVQGSDTFVFNISPPVTSSTIMK